MSWKVPRSTSENGGSSRSLRGVEQRSPAEETRAFEGAFVVSLPHTSTLLSGRPLSN